MNDALKLQVNNKLKVTPDKFNIWKEANYSNVSTLKGELQILSMKD